MATDDDTHELEAARRRFLAKCGRFSAATPPAIALLLAAADRNFAHGQSGPAAYHGSRRRPEADGDSIG